jgi:hypothetical protein
MRLWIRTSPCLRAEGESVFATISFSARYLTSRLLRHNVKGSMVSIIGLAWSNKRHAYLKSKSSVWVTDLSLKLPLPRFQALKPFCYELNNFIDYS